MSLNISDFSLSFYVKPATPPTSPPKESHLLFHLSEERERGAHYVENEVCKNKQNYLCEPPWFIFELARKRDFWCCYVPLFSLITNHKRFVISSIFQCNFIKLSCKWCLYLPYDLFPVKKMKPLSANITIWSNTLK